METEEIIARVAEGDYDVTLADSHILAVARSWRDDIQGAFELAEPAAHGWVVRRQNPELLAAVDAYLQREYRGLFYNVTREKYFGNPKAMRKRAASRPARAGAISPYDELVRRHAGRLGFDWRLVTAQMYQESRFDPTARSFAGASGLLQLMPRTAAELGYRDLEDPETSIEAALDYMTWLRKRFSREIPEPDRTWFSLAAYNVGFGHVRDARRIASDRGWDSDRWFDHVERAMLLKERPEVHRKTRYGYARGREPVAYVRNIRDRYAAYVQADHALPD
jgi:membrane-bound lytic murein transglycosylase F